MASENSQIEFENSKFQVQGSIFFILDWLGLGLVQMLHAFGY